MKSWHISGITILAMVLGIFLSANLNAPGIGATLMFTLFPLLVWFGWTLHERSLHRNEILEQRAMDRLRNGEGIALRRRKANEDV